MRMHLHILQQRCQQCARTHVCTHVSVWRQCSFVAKQLESHVLSPAPNGRKTQSSRPYKTVHVAFDLPKLASCHNIQRSLANREKVQIRNASRNAPKENGLAKTKKLVFANNVRKTHPGHYPVYLLPHYGGAEIHFSEDLRVKNLPCGQLRSAHHEKCVQGACQGACTGRPGRQPHKGNRGPYPCNRVRGACRVRGLDIQQSVVVVRDGFSDVMAELLLEPLYSKHKP